MKHFLTMTSALSGVLGLALLIIPATITRLLFGLEISDAIVPVGRLAGFTFLGLSVIWFSARANSQSSAARRLFASALIFNFLMAGVLITTGFRPEQVGILLWPLFILHVAMILWGVSLVWQNRSPLRLHF